MSVAVTTVPAGRRSALRVAGTHHESVVAELREQIVTGRIAPGEALPQVELAARLGVSRIPVREALRTLHAEGLVVISPNRGTICRPLEARDLSDLYAVRIALEHVAIRAAAERFTDLRSATQVLRQKALQAIERGDLSTLIDLDRNFHAGFAEASGNEHLSRALSACWSQIMRGMHYFFTLEAYPENVWVQHTEIAKAVANGDTNAGAFALDDHVDRSRLAILDGLRARSR